MATGGKAGRVAFLGSKDLGVRTLERIHALAPDRLAGALTCDDAADPRGRGRELAGACARLGVPLRVLARPADLAAALAGLKPDLVIVSGWYWRIPPATLALAPAGFYGLHASALPAYRGHAPLVWAILRGEREAGLTLFRFADGIDDGEVAAQSLFPIGPDDTIADALARAGDLADAMWAEHYPRILDGTVTLAPQDHGRATYGALRRPEDGRIDWSAPAARLHDFIRAQTRPYPGAFAKLADGRCLRVWRAGLFPRPYYGTPGLVCLREAGSAVVTCGDGALRLLRVEVEGEGETDAASVLRYGQRLG